MSDRQPGEGSSSPYPQMSPVSEEEERARLPEPPQHLRWAVGLMYLGALFSVIGTLSTLLMRGTLEQQMLDQLRRQQGQSVSPEQVQSLMGVLLVVAVVVGIISVGLWILMAVMNRRGRQWARITATVLGALSIASALVGLASGGSGLGTMGQATGVQLALSIVNVVLAAVILVLLWTRPTREWFSSVSDQRARTGG